MTEKALGRTMTGLIASGARLNMMLGKRVFGHGRVTDAEVVEATGLTIIQLLYKSYKGRCPSQNILQN